MKEKVQLFGRALSGMVMPNIGAFIAWGLITALFISTGWCPNETLAQLVDPMSKYLLPLASIFIEPAKVLFLNNAINHGILSPMGIQQVKEVGKSVESDGTSGID